MPNYQNGLIYKLCCKDTDITDFYIGSTTSFRHRKTNHKSDCNNEKSKNYNYNIYKFIRENGGFSNWDMILIEYYKCDTKLELEKREREVIENLKPSLNNRIPTRTYKEWCEDNKEYYKQRKEYHKQYNQEYYQNNIKEKAKEKITCECGAIITKIHFNRHLKSIKHQGYIVLKKNLNNI